MEEEFPDLGTLTDDELKNLIEKTLEEEEAERDGERRRYLRGKGDILRAELVNRLRRKREGGSGEWEHF